MTNNKQLQLALEIATMAHKNVQRRNGDPYIFHVLRVANNATYVRTKTQKAAAILHDTIEDTPFDADFLQQQGIDESVLTILDFLTHDKEQTSYENYIDRICQNVDAMMVKLADLTDNLDQGTLPVLTERDIARVRRALAAKGLWPKDYIYDTDDLVRSHVLGTHPEYITPGCDKSPAEWMTMKNVLEALPTIALGQLDMLLDASKQPGRDDDLAPKDVYDLKQESLLREPTTIERTMLPSELYKSGNPLWARNASIKQIENMKLYESEARHEGNFEQFLEQFDKLLSVANDYMRGVNIMRTSGAGMPF